MATAEEARTAFHKDLTAVLNQHSREIGSNTPDFILADYLMGCLESYDSAVIRREQWYGIESAAGEGTKRTASGEAL